MWLCVLLGEDVSGAHIMMGRIESAGTLTITIMVGFTPMMAARSAFIMTFHETSEHITTSSTAKIENSMIAIILNGGTNIPNTRGHPRDRRIGRNEILNNSSLMKKEKGVTL